MADLIDLIEELAPENPEGYNAVEEGLCRFCSSEQEASSLDEYPYTVFYVHKKDCVWVKARKLLGKDIAPHVVEP